MRFSHVAVAYFLMGAVMFGGGAIPYDDVGLTQVFVQEEGDGDLEANESAVGGDGGLLSNLIGPIRNALGTIAGGSLLAVWGALDSLLGYYAWPVTVLQYNDAPMEAVLLSGVLVASFTFGILRVFRASL